jgi:hypothetical protein
MIENSLMESYEKQLNFDNEIQVLLNLNELVIFDHIKVIKELDAILDFNLKLLIVINYIDILHFKRNYIVLDDNDNKEFNIKNLVKDILY